MRQVRLLQSDARQIPLADATDGAVLRGDVSASTAG